MLKRYIKQRSVSIILLLCFPYTANAGLVFTSGEWLDVSGLDGTSADTNGDSVFDTAVAGEDHAGFADGDLLVTNMTSGGSFSSVHYGQSGALNNININSSFLSPYGGVFGSDPSLAINHTLTIIGGNSTADLLFNQNSGDAFGIADLEGVTGILWNMDFAEPISVRRFRNQSYPTNDLALGAGIRTNEINDGDRLTITLGDITHVDGTVASNTAGVYLPNLVNGLAPGYSSTNIVSSNFTTTNRVIGTNSVSFDIRGYYGAIHNFEDPNDGDTGLDSFSFNDDTVDEAETHYIQQLTLTFAPGNGAFNGDEVFEMSMDAGQFHFNTQITPTIPEPTLTVMLGLSSLCLLGRRRKVQGST